MKKHDHDYEGKDRKNHRMDIYTSFDGELMWLTMKGTHSFQDGCYCHEWTHAMSLETLKDIYKAMSDALDRYTRLTLFPQFMEEWGGEEDLQECMMQ